MVTDESRRRDLWTAFDNRDMRCGRWSALHRAGFTIRAAKLYQVAEFRKPMPMATRQVRRGIGWVKEQYGPELASQGMSDSLAYQGDELAQRWGDEAVLVNALHSAVAKGRSVERANPVEQERDPDAPADRVLVPLQGHAMILTAGQSSDGLQQGLAAALGLSIPMRLQANY